MAKFIKDEQTRLILEREFLLSVLNDSLGDPERSNALDEEVAQQDLLETKAMLSRSRKQAILTKIFQDNNIKKKTKVTTGAIDAGSHVIPTISFDKMRPAKTEYAFEDEPIVGSVRVDLPQSRSLPLSPVSDLL